MLKDYKDLGYGENIDIAITKELKDEINIMKIIEGKNKEKKIQ